jgi:undecaprenyl-diphosphatase
MHILQALVLGLVQGLTEFIPVSSSGHLILVGHLLHFDGGVAFDAATNIGTLAALAIFFWKDFWDLARGLVTRTDKSRMAWLLVMATIPGVLAGLVLEHTVSTLFRNDTLVAVNLILAGVVMLYATRVGKRRYDLSHMTPERAGGIGLSQVLALFPGVSRSGITVSAGLFEGFDRVAATTFSFWLSAPILVGGTTKVLLKHSSLVQIQAEPVVFAVGILAAFISGLWAIRFMLGYLKNHGLEIFVWYRFVVGALFLVISLGHR